MLTGHNSLILGVANKRSIAWSIAERFTAAGARCLYNALNDKLAEKVRELVGEAPVLPCDVGDDASLDAFFAAVGAELRGEPLHSLVHSIAYAPREALSGDFLSTERDWYRTALDISAYSLVAVAQRAVPLMTAGGSIMTLTYLGSERAVPRYNVMGVAKSALESGVRYLAGDLGRQGIRVNAISAGPINTLSARGIRGFTEMLGQHAQRSAMGRNVTPEEVAGVAVFLASELSGGVTGEIIHVDAGYHFMGL